MKNAVKGLKWGRLIITDVVTTEVWSEPNNTGVKDYVVTVSMLCTCGREFTQEEWEIDKRVCVACPTCLETGAPDVNAGDVPLPALGFGAVGRPRHGKMRKVAISVTVPLDVLEWLQTLGDRHSNSVSAVLTGVLKSVMDSGVVVESTGVNVAALRKLEVENGKG